MKTVVSVNEISEFEIKPKTELDTWRKQVAEEIKNRWALQKDWLSVDCPVCKSKESTAAFLKLGFQYVECDHCKTLYAQKRPPENEINWWYTGSASVRYWQETLLKLSAASRDAKIIEPRAHWILDGLAEYIPDRSLQDLVYTDISFFGKALIEKIAEMAVGMQIISAGITDGKETYSGKNIQVKTIPSLNNITGLAKTDVLVAIDVLERISNISDLLQQLETVVNQGGLVFATSPVSSGFEIQSLWDRSPSIIPPDKLNLPSIKGLIDLITVSPGWKILELSTPGMFDVALVKQAMAASPEINWPRNLHALLDGMNQHGAGLFTEYLQSQRLCSFARIVLQRVK